LWRSGQTAPAESPAEIPCVLATGRLRNETHPWPEPLWLRRCCSWPTRTAATNPSSSMTATPSRPMARSVTGATSPVPFWTLRRPAACLRTRITAKTNEPQRHRLRHSRRAQSPPFPGLDCCRLPDPGGLAVGSTTARPYEDSINDSLALFDAGEYQQPARGRAGEAEPVGVWWSPSNAATRAS
jgi:hypothetical protein